MEDDENFNAWHIEKGMICNRPHAYIGKLFFFVFSLEVLLSHQNIKQLCRGYLKK